MRNNYFYEFGKVILIGVILGLLTAGVIEAFSTKNSGKNNTTTQPTVTEPPITPIVTATVSPTVAPLATDTPLPTFQPTPTSSSLPHFQINNPGGGDD